MNTFEAIEEAEFEKGQVANFEYEIKDSTVILYGRFTDWDSKTGNKVRELARHQYMGSTLEAAVTNAVEKHYAETKFLRPLRVHAKKLNTDEEPIKFVVGHSSVLSPNI
ncbi:MAG: hypothetical protein WCI72_03070 [archaeon]